jgi:hypothetical protein
MCLCTYIPETDQTLERNFRGSKIVSNFPEMFEFQACSEYSEISWNPNLLVDLEKIRILLVGAGSKFANIPSLFLFIKKKTVPGP